MYRRIGINGMTPQNPCSAYGPKAILYPNQLQLRIGIFSTKSYTKSTYTANIPKEIGANFTELIPSLRSRKRVFVSFIKAKEAATVKT